MAAPLIGITTRKAHSELYQIPLIASPRSYSEALINAGAIPILIPLNLPLDMLNDLIDKIDGVIFTGGGDIDPIKFNGEDHGEVYGVDVERDEIELRLVHNVVNIEKPFLGICRGIQIINVAYGGALYTHLTDQLSDEIQHRCFPDYPWDHIAHEIQISEDSRLGEIVGESIIGVNSLHHQGIKALAKDLTPVAYAPDGLIEAVELKNYPFGIAVQWHPEWLPGDLKMQALFKSFVEAARARNFA